MENEQKLLKFCRYYKGGEPKMITNNIQSSNLIHPGEMIKDEIAYRGISQKRLSAQTGISYSVLNEVLNCKRPVSIEYALLFEAVLGIDAEIWIKTQAEYDIQKAKSDRSFAKRLEKARGDAYNNSLQPPRP